MDPDGSYRLRLDAEPPADASVLLRLVAHGGGWFERSGTLDLRKLQ